MDAKLIAVIVIAVLIIGVAVYYVATSSSADVNTPPAFPDEKGFSAQALEIFSNADNSVEPPQFP